MDASTNPDAGRIAADLRSLQIVWGALVAGVALATGVLGGLTLAGYGPAIVEGTATLFYVNATVNMGAIVAAFFVQQRLVDQLPVRGTYEEVVAAVRTSGVLSLACLEASALVACVAAFLTGELVNLLFVVPFFGFAFVFFPTRARFAALLDVARHG